MPTSTGSLHELVEPLGRLCRFEIERVPFPADRKLIDVGDYYGDHSRLREAKSWRPQVRLEDALARTVELYCRHADVYL